MKLLLSLLLACAVLSAHEVLGKKWKRPDFCGDFDCPRYKREKKTDNYEIRTYEESKWVTTWVNGSRFSIAYAQGSQRLQKYFKGANDREAHCDLTTPTIVAMKAEEEKEGVPRAAEASYGFGLWIPEDWQEDPPQPTDGDVKIQDYDETTVYVSVFGGFASEASIRKEVSALHEVLKDKEEDFDKEDVFVAVYDPPQKLLKRHNEIHVPVAGKKRAAMPAA